MTIDVAFIPSTHTSFDLRRYEGFKKYRFICNYQYIKVGDVITSPDYSGKMIVTEVFPKDERTVHQGTALKIININTVNSNKLKIEMEKRNISITLEQARGWYKSSNETLKKLALSAYSEEELQPACYEGIMTEIATRTTCSCFTHPLKDEKTIKALNKLRNIANFFNEGWEKRLEDIGYFVTPNSCFEYNIATKKYGWTVLQHAKVKYPGIIYFKNSEDAVKALKIAYTEGWLDDLK